MQYQRPTWPTGLTWPKDARRDTSTFEQARFEEGTPGPPKMVTDVVALARTTHDPGRAALTGNPGVTTQHAEGGGTTAKRKAKRKVTRTAY